MNIKTLICAAAGSVGAVITMLVGGWSKDLITLIVFMGVDILTGFIVAGVFKNSRKTESGKLSSSASYKGILKKLCEIMLVVIAHMLDGYMGTQFIRSSVIIGFMVNELLSIIENAALMGIVSPAINEAIDILKKDVTK